jgi:hypothetical protein
VNPAAEPDVRQKVNEIHTVSDHSPLGAAVYHGKLPTAVPIGDLMLMPTENPVSRDSERRRVLMTGTVFTPAGAHRVRISDISGTGAHVVVGGALQPDCDAIFKKGAAFLAARVMWVRGKEAGLRFYRELSAEECAELFNSAVENAG